MWPIAGPSPEPHSRLALVSGSCGAEGVAGGIVVEKHEDDVDGGVGVAVDSMAACPAVAHLCHADLAGGATA